MSVNDNDKLLVNDGSKTKTITYAQFKDGTVLNDYDKFLINDGNKTETVTWAQLQGDLDPTGRVIQPLVLKPSDGAGTGVTKYLRSDTITKVEGGGTTTCQTDLIEEIIENTTDFASQVTGEGPLAGYQPVSTIFTQDWSDTGFPDVDVCFPNTGGGRLIFRPSKVLYGQVLKISGYFQLPGTQDQNIIRVNGIDRGLDFDTGAVPNVADGQAVITIDLGSTVSIESIEWAYEGSSGPYVGIGALQLDGLQIKNFDYTTLKFPSSNGFRCFKPGDTIGVALVDRTLSDAAVPGRVTGGNAADLFNGDAGYGKPYAGYGVVSNNNQAFVFNPPIPFDGGEINVTGYGTNGAIDFSIYIDDVRYTLTIATGSVAVDNIKDGFPAGNITAFGVNSSGTAYTSVSLNGVMLVDGSVPGNLNVLGKDVGKDEIYVNSGGQYSLINNLKPWSVGGSGPYSTPEQSWAQVFDGTPVDNYVNCIYAAASQIAKCDFPPLQCSEVTIRCAKGDDDDLLSGKIKVNVGYPGSTQDLLLDVPGNTSSNQFGDLTFSCDQLNSIEISKGSSFGTAISSITADGRLLVDAAYENNVWSDPPIFNDNDLGAYDGDRVMANAFSGRLFTNNASEIAMPETNPSGWSLVFDQFDDAKKVKVYAWITNDTLLKINQIPVTSAAYQGQTRVVTFDVTGFGLQRIDWQASTASSYCGLVAIQVDDRTLQNPDVRSFNVERLSKESTYETKLTVAGPVDLIDAMVGNSIMTDGSNAPGPYSQTPYMLSSRPIQKIDVVHADWSDMIDGDSMGDYVAENLFDGDDTSFASAQAGATLKLAPSKPIQVFNAFEMKALDLGASDERKFLKINGIKVTNVPTAAEYFTPVLEDSSSITEIKSIEWSSISSSSKINLYQLVVDYVPLIQGQDYGVQLTMTSETDLEYFKTRDVVQKTEGGIFAGDFQANYVDAHAFDGVFTLYNDTMAMPMANKAVTWKGYIPIPEGVTVTLKYACGLIDDDVSIEVNGVKLAIQGVSSDYQLRNIDITDVAGSEITQMRISRKSQNVGIAAILFDGLPLVDDKYWNGTGVYSRVLSIDPANNTMHVDSGFWGSIPRSVESDKIAAVEESSIDFVGANDDWVRTDTAGFTGGPTFDETPKYIYSTMSDRNTAMAEIDIPRQFTGAAVKIAWMGNGTLNYGTTAIELLNEDDEVGLKANFDNPSDSQGTANIAFAGTLTRNVSKLRMFIDINVDNSTLTNELLGGFAGIYFNDVRLIAGSYNNGTTLTFDSNTNLNDFELGDIVQSSKIWNQARTWSDFATGNSYSNTQYPKTNLFNGKIKGALADIYTLPPGQEKNGAFHFTFPAGIPFKLLKLWGAGTSSLGGLKINGETVTNALNFPGWADGVQPQPIIPTFDNPIGDVLYSVTAAYWTTGPALAAIEIDGRLLVDTLVAGETGEDYEVVQIIDESTPQMIVSGGEWTATNTTQVWSSWGDNTNAINSSYEWDKAFNGYFTPLNWQAGALAKNNSTMTWSGNIPSAGKRLRVFYITDSTAVGGQITLNNYTVNPKKNVTPGEWADLGVINDNITSIEIFGGTAGYTSLIAIEVGGQLLVDDAYRDHVWSDYVEKGQTTGSNAEKAFDGFLTTVWSPNAAGIYTWVPPEPIDYVDIELDIRTNGPTTATCWINGVDINTLIATTQTLPNRNDLQSLGITSPLRSIALQAPSTSVRASMYYVKVNQKLLIDKGVPNGEEYVEFDELSPGGFPRVNYQTDGGQGDILFVDPNKNTLILNDTGGRDNRWIGVNTTDVDFSVAGPAYLNTQLLTTDVALESTQFATSPSGIDGLKKITWNLNGVDQPGTTLNPYRPSGLTPSTDYTVKVKHEGYRLGESKWSPSVTFRTGMTRSLKEHYVRQVRELEKALEAAEAKPKRGRKKAD